MYRASWVERAWTASSMPVFLEKIILPLCVVIVGFLVFTNPMGFDWTQRITGSIAIVFAAYFVAHSLHKTDAAAPAPAELSKVFVAPEVTPKYLAGLYSANTTIQSDKLAAAYIGKWIKVSAKVTDAVNRDKYGVAILSDSDGVGLALIFAPKWRESIAGLPSGSEIIVIGKISKATSRVVLLDDCELAAP